MPRRKKRKPEIQVKPSGGRVRDNKIAEFWTRRIRAGLQAQEEYFAVARDVMNYAKSNHKALYDDEATRKHFMDFRGAAAISIPKIAQMRNALCPRLHHAKPVRTVTPTTDDQVMRGLALILRAYLNYTVKEAKFNKQFRKSVGDGVLRGRGFLQQVWEPVRKVITSTYVSSMDFVFDPDFDDIEDGKWIAIRVREPFWETKRRITEKWRVANLETHTQFSDDTHASRDDKNGRPRVSASADILEYWVVLSKMGKGFRGADMDDAERFNDSEDYCRLEIVLDHEVPIADGKWEIPLYLDKDWPIAYFDPIETIDEHTPESTGGQILSLQKGVDLLSSLNLTSCKNRNRMVMLVDDKIDGYNQDQLRHGTSADMISMKVPAGGTLESLTKVLDFGMGATAESSVERDFLLQQMEATTGVTNAITGGEEQDAKDRSATASQMRIDAASTRIGDLKQKVEEFATDVARKEALAVRLMLEAEDVQPIVRPSAINLFYVKVTPPGSAPISVRDTRPAEERKAQPVGKEITLEQVSPAAATYFDAPEQALEAAFVMWQDMQMSEEPRVIELATALMSEGMAMEDGLPMGVSIELVDVERVWMDTAGITPEELMREFSWEIASGSGQKIDKAAEQANADNMIQVALPVAMQAGDYNAVNKIFNSRDDAYDVPEEKRITLAPPPPPEQSGGGGEEKDKKGGDE